MGLQPSNVSKAEVVEGEAKAETLTDLLVLNQWWDFRQGDPIAPGTSCFITSAPVSKERHILSEQDSSPYLIGKKIKVQKYDDLVTG